MEARPDGDAEAVAWLLGHCEDKLTIWETSFLDDLNGAVALTPRQRAKLDEIWEDVVVKRLRG